MCFKIKVGVLSYKVDVLISEVCIIRFKIGVLKSKVGVLRYKVSVISTKTDIVRLEVGVSFENMFLCLYLSKRVNFWENQLSSSSVFWIFAFLYLCMLFF